jgi:tripartite-type tricarboxylate transporter receptor subunit TctC
MMKKICIRILMIAGLTGLLHGLPAQAQDYPSKPVRIVVPFAAGSATDALARLLAGNLSARWSQPFVVENRAGAGGNLGAEAVFRSAPDGSTLLFMPGPFVQKTLYPQLGYDPDGLIALSAPAKGYSVLVAHPKVAAQSLPELIAYARANPDKLNYASQGIASVAHLTGEMFKGMTNTKIVHVAYKGNAPAMADLLGGQVELMFLNLGSALPHIRSGKLRALGIGSEKRNPLLPDVPTIGETVPGFVSMVWFAMFAPPATPPAVASRLSAAVSEALQTPEIANWISTNTFDPVGGTVAETEQLRRQDNERWVRVIRATGIKAE